MFGPDRELTLTVRYSFKVVADHNLLKSQLGHLTDANGAPREPTASEMTTAFQMWKTKKIAETKLSFKTGNSLANDSAIEISTS